MQVTRQFFNNFAATIYLKKRGIFFYFIFTDFYLEEHFTISYGLFLLLQHFQPPKCTLLISQMNLVNKLKFNIEIETLIGSFFTFVANRKVNSKHNDF